jgi:hypothetical protein
MQQIDEARETINRGKGDRPQGGGGGVAPPVLHQIQHQTQMMMHINLM